MSFMLVAGIRAGKEELILLGAKVLNVICHLRLSKRVTV